MERCSPNSARKIGGWNAPDTHTTDDVSRLYDVCQEVGCYGNPGYSLERISPPFKIVMNRIEPTKDGCLEFLC